MLIKAKKDKVDLDPCIVNEDLVPYRLDATNAKGYDIWVSNITCKGARDFSFRPKDDGEQYDEISSNMIQEEINEFLSQFKDAVGILTKLYGKENVEVKWGVIHEIN